MKALILFSSRDGQAREIASYIANEMKARQACDVLNILHADTVDWAQYDRVLIGASIRYGNFHPAVAKFVKRHLRELQTRVSGFFCVNLTARKPEKRSPQTNA